MNVAKQRLMKHVEKSKPKAPKEPKMEVEFSKREEYEELMKKVQKMEEKYENMINQNEDNEQFIDTSRRTFFKEFKKVVKASDVILEVCYHQ